MKKHPVLMVSLSVLLALGLVGFAEAKKKKPVVQEEEVEEMGPVVVPEAAKRYLGQGKAIMDRAKSPQDYEEAIRAFEQAASLAPTWPDIYDDLAYAQENAEKYPEAIKSLRKYLTLAPSYIDKKAFETRIYKLEEKMKYMAGPGGDERLAQQLVGTWISANLKFYWEIEATGAKVRGKLWNTGYGPGEGVIFDFAIDQERVAGPDDAVLIFDAEVRKSRLVGTIRHPIAIPEMRRPKPMNWGFNLNMDGLVLTLDTGGYGFDGTFFKKYL